MRGEETLPRDGQAQQGGRIGKLVRTVPQNAAGYQFARKLAEETDWPYSFERICGTLDLDANAVRRCLRVSLKARKVAKACT